MYIKIRIFPDSKKEEVKKVKEDHFEVRVKEPAEQNRANRRLLLLMREYFAPEKKDIRIISGHHSPSKILSVE